jgi:hypothetical protein
MLGPESNKNQVQIFPSSSTHFIKGILCCAKNEGELLMEI